MTSDVNKGHVRSSKKFEIIFVCDIAIFNAKYFENFSRMSTYEDANLSLNAV